MGTVNLGDLRGDQIVIHYGGALTSVDAYTFANSLIAFADTVRAVNSAIEPSLNIEIRLEAIGAGSFRAILRRMPKGLGGFFSRGAEAVFWGIVGALICDKLIKDSPAVVINIGKDQVIIERDGDKIIIPRGVYDRVQILKNNPEIQRQITKTFQVIEEDPAIENFGVTPSIEDREPLFQIDRKDFRTLSQPVALAPSDPTDNIRERRERARLLILKAWMKGGNQKWAFEWNGVPISAPIKDTDFLSKLVRGEILFRSGDALDVVLYFVQNFDHGLGLYVNDQTSYQVEKITGQVTRAGGHQLPLSDEPPAE